MPWKEICAMDQKTQMIKLWKSDRYSITDLSLLHDVSRKTVYKWIKRYQAEGSPGLEERTRAPLHHINATSEQLIELIFAVKKRHPRWGPKKIVASLKEHDGETHYPAISTVSEILKRKGLVTPRIRRRRSTPYTAPFTACNKPNDVWSADFKGQFRMGNGKLCYPLTITDNYSRYLLCCKALEHPSFRETRPCFELVFKEFGLPEAIRTDNGAPFASIGLCSLSKLAVWFMKLGIRLERIAPGHPEQNGRHERMHRTLKATTADPPMRTKTLQQKAFNAFTHEYNCERPHEALEQKPPATVYRKSQWPYPSRLPKIIYHPDAIVRKVNRNGEISCKRKRIFISKSLIGEYIELKYREEDLWEIKFMHFPLGIVNVATRKVLPMCPD